MRLGAPNRLLEIVVIGFVSSSLEGSTACKISRLFVSSKLCGWADKAEGRIRGSRTGLRTVFSSSTCHQLLLIHSHQ